MSIDTSIYVSYTFVCVCAYAVHVMHSKDTKRQATRSKPHGQGEKEGRQMHVPAHPKASKNRKLARDT